MAKLSPQEILKIIAADFKKYGISYEQAADVLGYANKQSIANILNSKGNKYMPPETAKRFHDKCGYDIYTLLTGEGELHFNPPVDIEMFSTRGDGPGIKVSADQQLSDQSRIDLLENYLGVLTSISDNVLIQQLGFNYKERIKHSSNSDLFYWLHQNSMIIQTLLMEHFGPNSDKANTDPVVTIVKK